MGVRNGGNAWLQYLGNVALRPNSILFIGDLDVIAYLLGFSCHLSRCPRKVPVRLTSFGGLGPRRPSAFSLSGKMQLLTPVATCSTFIYYLTEKRAGIQLDRAEVVPDIFLTKPIDLPNTLEILMQRHDHPSFSSNQSAACTW